MKKQVNSQCEIVLNYLKNHGSITTFEAFSKFGFTRLSAIVYDLRRRGYVIASDKKECVTRFGKKAKFAEYRLIQDGKQ